MKVIYNNEPLLGKGEDSKFERLMELYLRMGKIMRINVESLIDIEGRVNELTERKNFRMKQGPEYLNKLKAYREEEE